MTRLAIDRIQRTWLFARSLTEIPRKVGIEMVATVSDGLERFVEQQIANGKYGTREEVLAAGLRLLQEREQELETIRAVVRVGLDELACGEGIVLEDKEARRVFFDDIKQRGREALRAETQRA